MTEPKTYRRGSIVFRQGDPGDCMYDIRSGRVGIYYHYGKKDEKLLSELREGALFGEMGLIEQAPRSADAVVLESGTLLARITEAEFKSYYEDNQAKMLMLMQQMCNRLRRTTNDYLEACSTVRDSLKSGHEKSLSLRERIGRFCAMYLSSKKQSPDGKETEA